MSPRDKKIVAEWLRDHCKKLEMLPHADVIREQINRLKSAADELWPKEA